MIKMIFSRLSFFATFLLLASINCQAQDWDFSASPYVWMAGVNGKISSRERSVSFDKNFSDLIKDMDVGAMGRFEATNQKLILTADLLYIDLGSNKDIARREIEADIKETIFELGAGYRLGDFQLSDSSAYHLTVDALGGARYFDSSSTIEGPFGRDPSIDISYWEPFLGPRVTLALDERWSAVVRTDLGGFNMGYDPYLSWQLAAAIRYQVSKSTALGLGYKFLHIYDLERRAVSADLKMDGLILGLTYSF